MERFEKKDFGIRVELSPHDVPSPALLDDSEIRELLGSETNE